MTVKLGVFLPTSGADASVPAGVAAAARTAEAAGLESVWATDHLVATVPMLDSTVALSTAAAATDRITVGFGVMLLALRPVAWAAKQIGTLQQLSGDRLVVGVGTGNPAHGDIGWRAAGVRFENRGKVTDEALRVLPGLVSGAPTVLADGLEVTLAPPALVPPVLVGGNGSRARRRAAEFGDGWVAIQPDLERLPAEIDELRELAERYGRPTPSITVVAPVLPEDPRQAAEQLMRYDAAGVERVILAPTPQWRDGYEFAGRIRAAQ
ncbi:LLM class flavin-dependent oxidoreductase [Nocardia jejuensis]|uniref:LLM class flavin-dependent oxidoreductase n=1 Tax=Nocardia jejuensis TaxID=328049 RepID=UPI000833241B|nr:LLM class flavin-dependent oxidoreductase [Nocardia jejuensis]